MGKIEKIAVWDPARARRVSGVQSKVESKKRKIYDFEVPVPEMKN